MIGQYFCVLARHKRPNLLTCDDKSLREKLKSICARSLASNFWTKCPEILLSELPSKQTAFGSGLGARQSHPAFE
jgi:hypothetical protein